MLAVTPIPLQIDQLINQGKYRRGKVEPVEHACMHLYTNIFKTSTNNRF